MDRRLLRVPVVIMILGAGLALGAMQAGGHPPPTPAAASFSPREVSMLMSYPSGRAHPEGPEAGEGAARGRRSYSAIAAAAWTGGGRHPQWRGCRHVYDPKLATFIFSSGASSR
jgi:hypothetical protein